jgi:tetratricopeptide (TPR) repeat protein
VTLERLDRDDEARTHQLEALRIRRAALGADHPQIARSLGHLGRLDLERGDLTVAVERHREALQIHRASGSSDTARAETALDLALALRELGHEAEVAPLLAEALDALPVGKEDALRTRIEAARAASGGGPPSDP